MEQLLDSLVGPLSKDWCYYFYVLALLSLLGVVAAVYYSLSQLFKKKGKFNFVLAFNMIVTPLFSYFIARLYYNMCKNSM